LLEKNSAMTLGPGGLGHPIPVASDVRQARRKWEEPEFSR